MYMITVEGLLNNIQKEKGIGTLGLTEGLCAYNLLQSMKAGETGCDLLLFSVLLQRMGESPDKLEYILSWQEYRAENIRNQIMLCIFRGREGWAKYAIACYEKEMGGRGAVHRMFVCRMRAMVAYWLKRDCGETERWLIQALDITFPKWGKKDWRGCRISVMELENILAFVRVGYMQGKEEEALLERCGDYIQEYVTDGEEYAKIYGKYVWLVARKRLEKEDVSHSNIEQTLFMCEQALKELCRYNIEYFTRPLLQLILKCCERLGERGKEVLTNEGYLECYGALVRLHQEYGVAYLPQDSLFWNCIQKMYHLESEVFRAERQTRSMTQAEAAEGIFAEPKTLRAVENDHSSPHYTNFQELMEKFGMHRGRRMGFVITDSMEALRLRKQIQGHISRYEYDKAFPLIVQMEEKLDMRITENLQTVKGIRNLVSMDKRTRNLEELLTEEWELLNMTYHLLPEELNDLGEVAIVKKKGRGRPKKGKTTKAYGYRVPFKAEADILNHIAILLKKTGKMEDALQLWGWLVAGFEQSRIKVEYRYVSYSLLLGNLAKNKCSLEEGIKVLHYGLYCGKLGELAKDYLTVTCAMFGDNLNRERCRQMIKDCYYLSKLSCNLKNKEKIEKYYLERFGENIEKI